MQELYPFQIQSSTLETRPNSRPHQVVKTQHSKAVSGMPFTNSETKSLIDQCSSGGFQQTVAQKSNTKLPINLDLSEYPKII